MLPFSSVHLFSVIIATCASMALGCIWYSPAAFGAQWMKFTKLSEKDAKEGMGKAFTIGFLAAFVTAYILALLLAIFSPASITEALTYGLLLWLGLILPLDFQGVAWEKRPLPLLLINSGEALVSVFVTVAILYHLS